MPLPAPWPTPLAPPPHTHTQITKTLGEQVSKYAQVVLDSAAYAGTGNVLKIQELLGLCGEHIETEEATAWKVRGTVLGGGERGGVK